MQSDNYNALSSILNEYQDIQSLSSGLFLCKGADAVLEKLQNIIPSILDTKDIHLYEVKKGHSPELISKKTEPGTPEFFTVSGDVLEWSVGRKKTVFFPGPEASLSAVISPIMFNGEVKSILVLYTDSPKEQFSQQQQNKLELLLFNAGVALENEKRKEMLSEKAEGLENMKKYIDFVVGSVMHGIISFSKNGEVRLFNKGAEEIFGIRTSMVTGKNFNFVFPQYLRDCFNTLFPKTLSEGQVRDHTISDPACPPGEISKISISTTLLKDDNSQTIGITAVCRDASISEKMISLKKKEMKNNFFLEMVSHELRTPISAIMASTEALRKGLLGTDPEKQEFLDLILDESQNLSRMVSDILDMSHLSKTGINPEISRISFEKLLEETLAKPEVRGAKTELKSEIPGVFVAVDKNMTEKALGAVLENSAANCRGDKRPSVLTESEEKWAILKITDLGPAENDNKFSDILHNMLDSSPLLKTTRPSGLDITVAAEIIKAQRGDISFKSSCENGNTFTIKLPLADPDSDAI
ncbi:MAG: histidine kinase dimerization/phospho-acceptor domain-containing protein [Fibrobacterota bacterium]